MHSPNYRRGAGEARHEAAHEVRVIQPRLHHARTVLSDDPLQATQALDAQVTPPHAQGGDRHAQLAQLLAVEALLMQGHDRMPEHVPGYSYEPVEHRLGAPLTQIRYDVQHFVDGSASQRITHVRLE